MDRLNTHWLQRYTYKTNEGMTEKESNAFESNPRAR